jgi:hypothetical protein
VHATNPQYMQRAMGEQAYDAYRSIAANAPIVGGMDKAIQLAANTMADRSPQAAEMRADMTKAAKASAADLVSSGWFGTFFQGDLGGVKNKWQVQNELTKLAGVAIQTGARSPEEAMQRAQEQIKANYIAVDGSLINKAQFPQLAKGDDFRKVVEEGKSVLVQRAGLTAGQSSNYDIVQTMTMSDGEPVFELRDSQGRTVRSPSGKPAMVTGREFPEFAKNITKRQFERIREAQSAVPLDFQTFPSP